MSRLYTIFRTTKIWGEKQIVKKKKIIENLQKTKNLKILSANNNITIIYYCFFSL